MVKALRAFLEFCYIARRNVHDTQSLEELDEALQRYHHYRKIFITTGVRTGFNLPHQHTLIHYSKAICMFGALNGLCSSIMESKHIEVVKEPCDSPVILKHFAKCFSLTNMLTSLQLPGPISSDGVCFKAPVYHGS